METVFHGYDADILRRRLATDGRTELESESKDFYASDYPEIEVSAPLEFTDEKKANRITVKEHYYINEFWTKEKSDAGGKELQCGFYARTIAGYVSAPEQSKRKRPYAIGHPVHIRETIDVKLPDEWDIKDSDISASLEAVRYSYKVRGFPHSFRLFHEYRSASDAVEVKDFPKYKAAMKVAEKNLYYTLSSPIAGSGDTESESGDGKVESYVLLGFIAVIGLGCGVALAVLLYFWNPGARVAEAGAPRGIAGWLVLPLIGCFIYPVLNLTTVDGSRISARGFSWRHLSFRCRC